MATEKPTKTADKSLKTPAKLITCVAPDPDPILQVRSRRLQVTSVVAPGKQPSQSGDYMYPSGGKRAAGMSEAATLRQFPCEECETG